MALKRNKTTVDVLRDKFCLTSSPFRVAAIFNPDNPGLYVPEVYGEHLDEFHRKFFLNPLDRDIRQTIGAVWSSHADDSEGRGFGKSMLMCEEARIVNRDFGASILERFDVAPEDMIENPFIAAYCSFDQSKGVQTFPAALLEGVAFALRCDRGTDGGVHGELRRRIAARVGAEIGYESEAIKRALVQRLTGFGNLGMQISNRQISGFIDALCHDDTDALGNFVREKIGPRIKAALGFNFVHIFNAFSSLAGIVHVVYFIDQVENFAKYARRQDRDVRILREAMCQTSPTADMASFVFQMHINALQVLEPIWQSEHLPSIDYSIPLNRGRIVDLQGLRPGAATMQFTAKLLAANRPSGVQPPTKLHPFNEDSLELVRQSVGGNPRRFLENLDSVLEHAQEARSGAYSPTGLLDLSFVQALVDKGATQFVTADREDDDDDISNPIR